MVKIIKQIKVKDDLPAGHDWYDYRGQQIGVISELRDFSTSGNPLAYVTEIKNKSIFYEDTELIM